MFRDLNFSLEVLIFLYIIALGTTGFPPCYLEQSLFILQDPWMHPSFAITLSCTLTLHLYLNYTNRKTRALAFYHVVVCIAHPTGRNVDKGISWPYSIKVLLYFLGRTLEKFSPSLDLVPVEVGHSLAFPLGLFTTLVEFSIPELKWECQELRKIFL